MSYLQIGGFNGEIIYLYSLNHIVSRPVYLVALKRIQYKFNGSVWLICTSKPLNYIILVFMY